jgi:hypothetical protein
MLFVWQVWRQITGSGWTQSGECEACSGSSNVETNGEQSDIRSGVMAWDRAVDICESMKQQSC